MKQFLDTRLKELKDQIGGDWRMIETPHFYCFANITPAQHQLFAQYNEGLYGHLQVVLRHKETDKLWNNKCPVYYFDNYARFQKFAVAIDQMPGAANSGGYFSARGREAHICIPFMNGRAGVDKSVEEMALSTLKHEGTHAFLQLTGETVTLTKWMHEGMAQVHRIYPLRTTDKPSREREQRAMFLARLVKSGEIPSWEEMKNRPKSGGDLTGYCFAWAKVEFLYRNFDQPAAAQPDPGDQERADGRSGDGEGLRHAAGEAGGWLSCLAERSREADVPVLTAGARGEFGWCLLFSPLVPGCMTIARVGAMARQRRLSPARGRRPSERSDPGERLWSISRSNSQKSGFPKTGASVPVGRAREADIGGEEGTALPPRLWFIMRWPFRARQGGARKERIFCGNGSAKNLPLSCAPP